MILGPVAYSPNKRKSNMSLIVNRRDLEFQMYEVLGLQDLLAQPHYSAFDRQDVASILDTAQSLAEDQFLPFAGALDANEPHFVNGKVAMMPEVGEALGAYRDAGFFAASFDNDAGGLQLPSIVALAANGMFACANAPVFGYAFLTIAATNLLNTFGSDEQKRVFLTRMLAGEWFGTMCLSEPQAGSSLSDITTRADPNEDGTYNLTGSKMWISGGDHELSGNIVHMVLAKIPGGAPGVKGISLFIVPRYRVNADGSLGQWNNIALAGLNHKMGQRGTTNCLLNLGEIGETIGYLVGEPHQGLRYMFNMMNEARLGVGYLATMSALGGYLYSLDYARTRLQGRKPSEKDARSQQVALIEHTDVRRMLLAQKAAVEGALGLAMYCSRLVDERACFDDPALREENELLLDILTPMAKSWPSEYCLEANKLAIQVLGGYGYTRDYPVERLYRDNRLNHIHEGAYGIQGIDLLGRKVRMQGGRAYTLLREKISDTLAIANGRGEFEAEVRVLDEALRCLDATTEIVLACAKLELSLANATVYLDAFGHIVIAWTWLRQAIAAQDGLMNADGEADSAFYCGKLAAFRYFFRYELPLAMPKLALVRSLDDTCLSISEEEFV